MAGQDSSFQTTNGEHSNGSQSRVYAQDSSGRDPDATTVLILEDEPTLLEIITEMLTQKGMNVTPADTVLVARDHLAATSYDLFLTDIVIQGEFSGASLAKEAYDHGRASRVVVMSGHPKHRALAGQDDTQRLQFLKKPFSYDELLSAIAEE